MEKNKLYAYGCSFAWTPNDTRTWPHKVAEHFNLELVNTGFPGQGILQHFKNWKDLENDMNPGDMNVVVLSSPDRTFFFPEVPFFSQLVHAEAPHILDKVDKEITTKIKNAKDAYINYYAHLHNPDHFLWFIECWLRWLDTKSKELGTKTIIISAFDENLPALNGNFENLLIFKKSLNDICQSEYAHLKFGRVFNGPNDLRANHLCLANHNILTQKIVDSVNLGYVTDSFSDWHTQIINDENVLNSEWRDNNFCKAKFDEKFFYDTNIYDVVIEHLVMGDY